MKIYVAASSSELPRAEKWIRHLTDSGLTVTSTWPTVIASVGEANPRDASDEKCCGWVGGDLHEVKTADLLWMLVPQQANGRGAYFEAGYAVALDKRLVFSGDTKQSIFCSQGAEYADDMDAFAFICRTAREAKR